MRLKLTGTCYVLVQVDAIHPIAERRHDLVWYPERGMTFLDCVDYQPYIKSIVTENPWIISCYSRENVQIWKDGEWLMPNDQTYGASVNFITMKLLGWRYTIPSTPLDGGALLYERRKELGASYESYDKLRT